MLQNFVALFGALSGQVLTAKSGRNLVRTWFIEDGPCFMDKVFAAKFQVVLDTFVNLKPSLSCFGAGLDLFCLPNPQKPGFILKFDVFP